MNRPQEYDSDQLQEALHKRLSLQRALHIQPLRQRDLTPEEVLRQQELRQRALRDHCPDSHRLSAEAFHRMIDKYQQEDEIAYGVWQQGLREILKVCDNVDNVFAVPATTNQNTNDSSSETVGSPSRAGSSTEALAVATPAVGDTGSETQGFRNARYTGIFQRRNSTPPGILTQPNHVEQQNFMNDQGHQSDQHHPGNQHLLNHPNDRGYAEPQRGNTRERGARRRRGRGWGMGNRGTT